MLSKRTPRNFMTTAAALLLFSPLSAVFAQSVGGNVTFAITEEPDTLDVQKTSTAAAGLLARYFGDTLITKDVDGEYVPGLAESWDVTEDGLIWTFTLKEGVTFQNGTPVTAEAVAASISRATDPDTMSPIAAGLYEPVTSMETPDATTLVLQLEEAFSPFMDNLTDPRAAIVDVAAAGEAGSSFGRTPVMTGPWQVTEWNSGDSIVMTRNADYAWGPAYLHDGAPYIETLTFRIIPESATQVAAFEAREVQVLGIPPTDVDRLVDSGAYQIYDFLRLGVGLFMEFNTQAAPFDDETVRTAMNYAIMKEPIVQVALRGHGEVAHGALPPSIWGYWDGIEEYAPSYDPERALELFSEAGWTRDGDGPLQNADGEPFTFTLYTTPTDTWIGSAQIVQAQLAELGIDMEIQTFEFGTMLEKLQAGEHQADFMGYTYTSPDIVHLWFHSSNIGIGLAHSHFDDEALDGLIRESRVIADTNERFEVYAEIQRYITDRALWVPLWTNTNYMAVQPDVKDARIHADGYLVLLDAYIE